MSITRSILALVLLGATFSYAWYGNKIASQNTPTYCIMLNPAGDAHHVGRVLDSHFERGLTLQCAQHIKEELEQRLPHVRVVLTRAAGQTVAPLQHAQFANRLGVDLYVSLHFYKEEALRSQMYMYSFSYGNDQASRAPGLQLMRYDTVYRLYRTQTRSMLDDCYKALMAQADIGTIFEVHKPQALPHAELIGIAVPACAFEIGLKNNDDWTSCAIIMCQALLTVITQREAS